MIVIGAGIGGLSAALDLACRGASVTVIERSLRPGGKMREVEIDGHPIDSGPTVFTMPWVFEALFAEAGSAFEEHLTIRRAGLLARHAWPCGGRLDLFEDRERSAAAIADFAGHSEAAGFHAFSDRASRVFKTLDASFIRNPRPSLISLIATSGLRGLGDLWRLKAFRSLWSELGEYFRDPRLHSLFARYATYCGASPLEAPATLMLIAHVEQCGVWRIEGGMQRLAEALAEALFRKGGEIRYGESATGVEVRGGRVVAVSLASGDRLPADAVVANVDATSIANGALGTAAASAMPGSTRRQRSLSAITWSLIAETSGFELAHHNVFFPEDYPREFEEIFGQGALPNRPAVYVCAQDDVDTHAEDRSPDGGFRRLFMITNAPADGDRVRRSEGEIDRHQSAVFALLNDCGLKIDPDRARRIVTTPSDFEDRFPGSGGALYGNPPHGWRSSFARPSACSRLPGLYLAGGSVHPGPGVPMVALGGRFAARAVAGDLGLSK